MRKAVWSLAVLGLAACQPTVPNSAPNPERGVGFGDYATYLKNREAELRGQAPAASSTPPAASTAAVAPAVIVPPGGGYGTTGYGATPATAAGIAAQAPGSGSALEAAAGAAPQGSLGAEALAALQATAPASAAPSAPASGGAGAPLSALSEGTLTPSAAAPVSGAAGSGAAVTGASGPNLAAYALSAPSTYGQPYYNRGGLKLGSSERACARFVSSDLAQMKFLERGGPERDPGNLDPDGDGFACGWDPRPFQTARQ